MNMLEPLAATASATLPRVAVLLPCYNEEAAIAQTVAGFRARAARRDHLRLRQQQRGPHVEVARAAGAIVRTERIQGKGTCRPPDVRRRRRRHLRHGRRRRDLRRRRGPEDGRAAARRAARHGRRRAHSEVEEAYRRGHRFGNALLTGMLARLFGRSFTRHPVRLPRLFAPLRQELPVAVGRVRDRDRDQRPRARARRCRSARSSTAYARAPRRLGIEALHLSRRLADPADDPERSTGSSGRCCSSARSRCCSWPARAVLGIPLVMTYVQTGLVPALPDRDPVHRPRASSPSSASSAA